ncbi:MAG: hypothetical protein CME70_18800 [Halobacteriovorax sp.]|nr:hypothetical protein [Halobacteriovorax sp.]|tara:strand:+ start:637 stop:1422 length:786 start_codon:yes stop_codon:yes gene_type:complete
MKERWVSLKARLLYAGFWLSLKLRLYSLWGMIVRIVADRKFKKVILHHMSPEEYDRTVKSALWKPDIILGRKWLPLDMVRSGRRFHWHLANLDVEKRKLESLAIDQVKRDLNNSELLAILREAQFNVWPKALTDCDDFTQYGAVVIDPKFAPLFFAVGSYESDGTFHGHAVVVTICYNKQGMPEGLQIRGNWGKRPHVGKFQTLDQAHDYVVNGMGGSAFSWGLWKVSSTWPEKARLIDFGKETPPSTWDAECLLKCYNGS